jgi:hypothetical protein
MAPIATAKLLGGSSTSAWPSRKHLGGLVLAVERQGEPDGGPDLVQPELELDDHPEVAAEGQPAHPGMADHLGRGGEPVLPGGGVHVGQQGAAAHLHAPGRRVDLHVVHPTQVDHQPVVRGGEAGEAVAAIAHHDLRSGVTGERDGGSHVRIRLAQTITAGDVATAQHFPG